MPARVAARRLSLVLTLLFALQGVAAEAASQPVPRPRLDAWGNSLPPRALFRTGTLRAQHDVVGPIHFSPDGEILAAVAGDGTIRLWEAPTGKSIRTLPGYRSHDGGFAFSADGKTIAIGAGDSIVYLWDVASGREMAHFAGHQYPVKDVVIAPGNTWLASCDRQTIRFWDIKTRTQIRLISAGVKQTLWSLTLSVDGKYLAAGRHPDDFGIWDTATGKELDRFRSKLTPIHALEFLRDGKTLLSFANSISGATVWEVSTGKQLSQIDKVSWPYAVSQDGKMIADAYPDNRSGVIRVRHLSKGNEIGRLRGHKGCLSALAFSPSGRVLVSVGEDATLRRWDLNSGEELGPVVGHENAVNQVAFSLDGKLVASSSADGSVRLWNSLTGREVRTFHHGREVVQGIAFMRDGRTLLTRTRVPPSGRWNVSFWEAARSRVRQWDLLSGSENRNIEFPDSNTEIMAFSPSSLILAQGNGDKIRLVDAQSGKQRWSTDLKHDEIAHGMAFSPDGVLLGLTSGRPWFGGSLSSDGPAYDFVLWNVVTKQKCWQTGAVFGTNVAFSPDGKVVVTGGGGRIQFWDIATGKELRSIAKWTRSLAFSPDGRTLATCDSDDSIILWEVATLKERNRLAGHRASCLAFSPDGRLLATSGDDTMVMVWDVTGRLGNGRLRPGPADRKTLTVLWNRLADEDGVVAHDAVWSLVALPEQAIPFLRDRLSAGDDADLKRVHQLIAQLDAEQSAVRETAKNKIEKMGMAAEAALVLRLEQKPSEEMRQRVERLLGRIRREGSNDDSSLVRGVRAIEVLVKIGTTEAKKALAYIANQSIVRPFTLEAKNALLSLEKRTTGPNTR